MYSAETKNSISAGPIGYGLLFLSAWIFFVLCTPSSFYWRDSAEFIVAAYAQDIAHPAGYPLYNQLANLFALLPIGTIAWRVNLFSGFCAALVIMLTVLLLTQVLEQLGKRVGAFALLPVLVLIQSPSFLRQAVSAEVYMLYTALFLLLLLLLVRFEVTRDPRHLIAAAFLGGVSLGNHVALALSIVLITLLLGWRFAVFRKAVVPGLLFGFWGLAVYLYLPLRSSEQLPLNTGAPINLERAWNLVTDLRDRELKVQNGAAHSDFSLPLAKFGANFQKDLGSLNAEIGWVLLALAVAGIWALARARPLLAGFLVVGAIGNWAFFQGWQPDPWLPLFVVISLFAGASVALAPAGCEWYVRASLMGLVIFSCLLRAMLTLSNVQGLSAARGAEQLAELVQTRFPVDHPRIVEASWFSQLYFAYIRGEPSGAVPMYQPRLLFPYHFEPVGVADVATAHDVMQFPRAAVPNTVNLGNIVRRIAPVAIEPNVSLNSFFSGTLILNADASVTLSPGKKRQISPQFLPALFRFYDRAIDLFSAMPRIEQVDAQPYIETLLTNDADLLDALGQRANAVSLLERVCAKFNCSPTIQHNLGYYRTSVGVR